MTRIVEGSTLPWALRVANREEEVTEDSDHHSLLADLMEHIHLRVGLSL